MSEFAWLVLVPGKASLQGPPLDIAQALESAFTGRTFLGGSGKTDQIEAEGGILSAVHSFLFPSSLFSHPGQFQGRQQTFEKIDANAAWAVVVFLVPGSVW